MAIDPLDLVFRPDSRAPLELVFGDDAGTGSAPEYSLAGGGQITGLRRADAGLVYDYNVERPALAWRHSRMQQGAPASFAVRSNWQRSDGLTVAHRSCSDPGLPTTRGFRSQAQQADALTRSARAASEIGVPLVARGHSRFEQTVPLHAAARSLVQSGRPVIAHVRTAYEAVIRLSRYARAGYQAAVPVLTLTHQRLSDGIPLLPSWRQGYQAGRLPPYGHQPHVTPPGRDDWCYVPTDPIELLFRADERAPLELLFECDRHAVDPEPGALIVVPQRNLYMTLNTLRLKRVEGDVLLPATGIDLSIDDRSFTWGWSADFGGTKDVALVETALDPDSGNPVEVELSINGVPYRLLTDPISRERRFARQSLRVPGRGLAAELDEPSAPQMVFSQSAARTAQQLAGEALQVNGVGIGWNVDWQLADWLVPGGSWSHQGTHISAVMEIAAAAGGYVQPHAVARTLKVLPRYPAPPWEWSELEPDYELPVGPVTVEGIEWVRLPAYNRVHLFQEGGPTRGRVTRAGTDGALEAPQIVHPLITASSAVLQAGVAALSNTGKQAMVSLQLPVLDETGLILPGKLVRYVDGTKTRLGLVRSTSVSWQRPRLRQIIKLETHILEGE